MAKSAYSKNYTIALNKHIYTIALNKRVD